MEIQVKHLCKAYIKNKNVLENVNLSLESPSLIGLVGPNGAGKTTLMKLLAGQLYPTEGTILVDGLDLQKNEKYLKRRLGYLPQDFGLYEELTVYQFLDYMASVKGIIRNQREMIEKSMMDTNLLDKKQVKIKQLSGGQKQRVGIAQALLNNPELCIVDEPTVGLDPEERIKFRNLFSRNANRRIMILSTHIIDDVESICNRLIVMNGGKILFDGLPQRLIEEAEGHVAILELEQENEVLEKDFVITSRIITSTGIRYRIVGELFPPSSIQTTPLLEDAYMYRMKKGE